MFVPSRAPCENRFLRKLGYVWVKTNERDRRESWVLRAYGELTHASVYWNGDGHEVRLCIGGRMVREQSVDLFRGPTPAAAKSRATAIMAILRGFAERALIHDTSWVVVRGGGDAKARRKVRRWGLRCIAAARSCTPPATTE